MNMILDCSSQDTARSSICKIFNTSDHQLTSLLKSLHPYQYTIQSPEDYIYTNICNTLGRPNSEIEVVWFHGTRVASIESFCAEGILPKSTIKNRIESTLKSLASGLEREGENPFTLSLAGKQSEADEGPFAFLFREVAVHAPGFNHSYVDAPEMVEDIAGALLGENYHQLVERYKSITKPYMVSFAAEAAGYELRYALWYLHSIEDGESAIEAASIANTCFNSNGKMIEPHRILGAELITNV